MPHIDLDAMADDLRRIGWTIERPTPTRLLATHPEHPVVYEVAGDDEIAEGCCYANGIMVEWHSLDAIRRHLGSWAKGES